jgi:hypothetical protein
VRYDTPTMASLTSKNVTCDRWLVFVLLLEHMYIILFVSDHIHIITIVNIVIKVMSQCACIIKIKQYITSLKKSIDSVLSLY